MAQGINSITVGENKEGEFHALKNMGVHVVRAITDPMTFVLDDNQVVRLSEIDLPVYPGEDENPFAVLAHQRMKALFLGQKITLYQTRDSKKGRTNAFGQDLGHIVKREADKEVWAQGVLVEEGLVRYFSSISNDDMSALLLERERVAREAQKGLWETQKWNVKTPDTVMPYVGTIQVVEGVVSTTASKNNLIFLNFGADWKEDFTIAIESDVRRQLNKNGLNPLGLSRQKLRVRGYVEDRYGPSITLDAPDNLEIVE